MQVIITALGPDNRDLVNPIISFVTAAGANISEIQMYDHDTERIFAMLVRVEWGGEGSSVADLRSSLQSIGRVRGLQVRVWARDETNDPPRIAICVTNQRAQPLALLQAMKHRAVRADAVVLIGNRDTCRDLASDFDVSWHDIGDSRGRPDNEGLVQLLDHYEVDYVVLARYMRVLPATTCWKFAGGRIINLHHGLLPSFPGKTPYSDAFTRRMLTYGATAHFIVPELDAGDQIIHQDTFTVAPGTPLEAIVEQGQETHEPQVLVEGVRRVVDREVELHFHRVVSQLGSAR